MIELGATSGSITNDLLSYALDAANQRQMTIATNIANVNTLGFKPLHVDFEHQMNLYASQFLNRGMDAASKPAIENLRTGLNHLPVSASTASKVQLDVEMAAMTRNALWYKALLDARSRASSILSLAINGGR